MKILQNKKEEYSEPLCSCNSKWPYAKPAIESLNVSGHDYPLYAIVDERSVYNGKQLVFFEDGSCQVCGMIRWRIINEEI